MFDGCAGYAGHDAILSAFRALVEPAARRFAPDLILVSAGYDAHVADPFQLLQYRSATFHALGARLAALARELCSGRVVFMLEGGYNVAALGESVVETWLGVLGEPSAAAAEELPHEEPEAEVEELLDSLREIHDL
jgi:acetoin utilization deacetylase AcuC-like enzyme